MTERLLSDLRVGETAEIIGVRGGRGFRARLASMGLREGQIIKKLSRVGWGGPVVILVNRAQVAIGRGMSRKIVVRTNHGSGD
ncbi:ferrous iron transport protein A [candidate division WOR-3 bacterium]|uniref:Ferrous iron transport protein A n=1 Tax=candidate division WOR-3 bacterium TaxID=2052148 RepID=A0A9D5K888_UNCW3|nr:ferrous iron transport protein A [candidate division WOR-3 bacterium]MBD3364103.1 ferrous iron transport protein A [candidate division WOR-3 bacterium]